jgi:hypothetical protein
MDVGGIGQYVGLYSPYRVNEIPKVDVAPVKEQDKLKNDTAAATQIGDSQATGSQSANTQDNRSRIANLENISLTFNKNSEFDYLGQDSNIQSLDMQKAISDMQKDSVLQEYQYFVGSSNSLTGNFSDEDGTVFPKQN